MHATLAQAEQKENAQVKTKVVMGQKTAKVFLRQMPLHLHLACQEKLPNICLREASCTPAFSLRAGCAVAHEVDSYAGCESAPAQRSKDGVDDWYGHILERSIRLQGKPKNHNWAQASVKVALTSQEPCTSVRSCRGSLLL